MPYKNIEDKQQWRRRNYKLVRSCSYRWLLKNERIPFGPKWKISWFEPRPIFGPYWHFTWFERRLCLWCNKVKHISKFRTDRTEGSRQCKFCADERHKINTIIRSKKDPDRIKKQKVARRYVNAAVFFGDLKKIEICEDCKKQPSVEAHHHLGYDYPLMVMWLCKSCHTRQTVRELKINNRYRRVPPRPENSNDRISYELSNF